MKADVVVEKGKLAVVDDCPMPEIGPYDALVRIDTCGFCNGTDTRIIYEQMSRKQGLQEMRMCFSPTLRFFTFSPTSTTTPTASCPSSVG